MFEGARDPRYAYRALSPDQLAFRKEHTELLDAGWRNAGDIGIYWGNVVGSRTIPQDLAKELSDPKLVRKLTKQDGSTITLYAPQALARIGESLLEMKRFEGKREKITDELQHISERFSVTEGT